MTGCGSWRRAARFRRFGWGERGELPIPRRRSIFASGGRLAGKEGAMSLVKRKGSANWYVDLEKPDGSRHRESTGTSDKQRAKEYHDRLKAKFWDESRLGAKQSFSWEAAVERYLVEIKVDGLAEDTIRNYSQHLEWWGEQYFKGKDLSEVTKGKVMEGVYKLAADRKQSTANRYLSTIRAMLYRAESVWEVINAPSKFKQFDEAQYERSNALSPEEIARVAKELPSHLRQMFLFSVATGLRQANVKKLRWSWINMTAKTVTVPAGEFKNRKELVIPLTETAIAVTRQEIGKHKEFVFTYQHQPVDNVSTRAWRNALQRAGIDGFTWHDSTRHTWAHNLRKAGVELEDIQDLGGWKDAKMVRRYATPDLTTLAQKAAKIDAALAGTHQRHTPDLKVVGGTASV